MGIGPRTASAHSNGIAHTSTQPQRWNFVERGIAMGESAFRPLIAEPRTRWPDPRSPRRRTLVRRPPRARDTSADRWRSRWVAHSRRGSTAAGARRRRAGGAAVLPRARPLHRAALRLSLIHIS